MNVQCRSTSCLKLLLDHHTSGAFKMPTFQSERLVIEIGQEQPRGVTVLQSQQLMLVTSSPFAMRMASDWLNTDLKIGNERWPTHCRRGEKLLLLLSRWPKWVQKGIGRWRVCYFSAFSWWIFRPQCNYRSRKVNAALFQSTILFSKFLQLFTRRRTVNCFGFNRSHEGIELQ